MEINKIRFQGEMIVKKKRLIHCCCFFSFLFQGWTIFAIDSMNKIHEPKIWECRLQFEAEAEANVFILKRFKLYGTGSVECHKKNFDVIYLDYNVELISEDVSLRVGFEYFSISGISKKFQLKDGDLRTIFGTYTIDQQSEGVFNEKGKFIAHKLIGSGGTTLQIATHLTSGIGVHAQIESMKFFPPQHHYDFG